MRKAIIRECRRLAENDYTLEQIALAMGVTVEQARYAVDDARKANGGQEKQGSPDELIDGERLEDRIKRLRSEIRSGRLVIERVR